MDQEIEDDKIIKEFAEITIKKTLLENPAALQACKDYLDAMDYLNNLIITIERNKEVNSIRIIELLEMWSKNPSSSKNPI